MQATASLRWPPRIAALVMGALLAASVVYWYLHWPRTVSAHALPVALQAVDSAAPDAGAIAKLLGAPGTASQAAPLIDASSRFRLTGVIASTQGQGVALLSVNGQPAKPYRVGSSVAEGLVLHSVGQRRAALSASMDAPPSLRLELQAR